MSDACGEGRILNLKVFLFLSGSASYGFWLSPTWAVQAASWNFISIHNLHLGLEVDLLSGHREKNHWVP